MGNGQWNDFSANTGEINWADGGATITSDNILGSPWTLNTDAGGWDVSTQTPYRRRKTINIKLKKKFTIYDLYNATKINKPITFNDVEEAPIDLISASNRAFALEAINEESKAVIADSNLLIDVAGIDAWKGYSTFTNKTLDVGDNDLTSTGEIRFANDGDILWKGRPTITIRLKGAKYYQSVPCDDYDDSDNYEDDDY